jgi:quercetin dioxygenase-like cupin family protein
MKSTIALVLSLIGIAAATAQAPVPVQQEPRHHFKFDNQYVRVFDVVVPPGDATLFHTHSNDYVFVSIGDANLKAELMGGRPSDLILKNGEVRFSKAPVTHRVSNGSSTPFRNITVEILKSGTTSGAAAPITGVPGHSAVLENERVRVERLVLEPGQSTGAHTHSLMCLAVTVAGSKLQLETQGQKTQTLNPTPGESNWFGEKRPHTLKNIGSTRFEAVEIEWK